MERPAVLVMTGYGINCEEDTAFAFRQAGADPKIVHVNDLISGKERLKDFRILAFPGGFSYGDDTGSGYAFANRIRNNIWEEVKEFVEDDDHLVIGICNGFQIMTNLGLVPAMDGKYGERQTALLHNDGARYIDRWVDVQFSGNSPWIQGVGTIPLPIAHGEGKFHASEQTLAELQKRNMIAGRYVPGEICDYQKLPANPTGTLDGITAVTDESGRLLGMMPHPERAIHVTQLPHWTYLREHAKRRGEQLQTEGSGLQLFRNAVAYYQ